MHITALLPRAARRLFLASSIAALLACGDESATVGAAKAPPVASARAAPTSNATDSRHGAGAASRAYHPGDASASFEIDHGWRVDSLAIVELIDVHVLAGDDGWSSFAYARAADVDGTPGEGSDVALAPAPIDAT